MRKQFRGYLENTDSSILYLRLQRGCRFEAGSKEDYRNFVEKLTFRTLNVSGEELKFPYESPSYKYFKDHVVFNAEREEFYYISLTLDYDGEPVSPFTPIIQNYIQPTLRLMRLFKEGDIQMRFGHFYNLDAERIIGFYYPGIEYNGLGRILSVQDLEKEDLQRFLDQTPIVFRHEFLRTATEAFDLSLTIKNLTMAFLALMIASETLFNRGHSELRYRIARNTAALLGESRSDARRIFGEVRRLYDLRSRVVHTGRLDLVSDEDFCKLRDYVRASIREIITINQAKDELMDLLNDVGLGERPWRMDARNI